jgi:hypothetical protein
MFLRQKTRVIDLGRTMTSDDMATLFALEKRNRTLEESNWRTTVVATVLFGILFTPILLFMVLGLHRSPLASVWSTLVSRLGGGSRNRAAGYAIEPPWWEGAVFRWLVALALLVAGLLLLIPLPLSFWTKVPLCLVFLVMAGFVVGKHERHGFRRGLIFGAILGSVPFATIAATGARINLDLTRALELAGAMSLFIILPCATGGWLGSVLGPQPAGAPQHRESVK